MLLLLLFVIDKKALGPREKLKMPKETTEICKVSFIFILQTRTLRLRQVK